MDLPLRLTREVSFQTTRSMGLRNGLTDWFEAGLYLPLYSISGAGALDAGEQRFFGPLRDFYPAGQQQHQLFGVFDYHGKP
jgi:hypothetical protein